MGTTCADLLDEYAQALRHSWGDIDGRSEKAALNVLSTLMREHGMAPLSDDQVRRMRDDLGVCLLGGQHWQWFCDDYKCYKCEEA